jgi:hypothetical protein
MAASSTAQPSTQLRRGRIVQLRSPAEILATLDEKGALEGVPFMPEMLGYFGRPFEVTARLERACDTIERYEARRMPNTVVLEDLRCDGSGHDGCEAGCRLYWKEAWLRPASDSDTPEPPTAPDASFAELEDRVRRNTRVARQNGGGKPTVYRCQATEFLRGTEPLRWYDPKSFLRELSTGNVGFWVWLRVTTRAALHAIGTKIGLSLKGPVHPRPETISTAADLHLQQGDLVKIKSKGEIEKTLDEGSRTRGLWFDREMLPYCGQTRTVLRPITRFIDEQTGEMVELKTDAIILDGVVCQGHNSIARWFCPRAIYPWWRECWLERVESEKTSTPPP